MNPLWPGIVPVLERISDVAALESSVVWRHPDPRYHDIGFAGTVDCIARLGERGVLALIDWKTSNRHRATLADLYDYPLQAVAYAGAANYDRNYDYLNDYIRSATIVVAYADRPADVFEMDEAECGTLWSKWLQRLDAFWRAHAASWPPLPPPDKPAEQSDDSEGGRISAGTQYYGSWQARQLAEITESVHALLGLDSSANQRTPKT